MKELVNEVHSGEGGAEYVLSVPPQLCEREGFVRRIQQNSDNYVLPLIDPLISSNALYVGG